MKADLDRAAWSPARCGTALGRLLSLVMIRRAGGREPLPGARSRQPWQNRWELLTAAAFWCVLPPVMAAALLAPLLSPVPRVILWMAAPLLSPVAVQVSIFLVGALVLLLRRAGLLRSIPDGRLQLLAWGGSATVLAWLGLQRGGAAELLGLFWMAGLLLEAVARLAALLLRNQLAEAERAAGEAS